MYTRKIVGILLFIFMSCLAQSVSANPKKPYYLGIGMFSNMTNVNAEFVTKWGNFMVKGGQFYPQTNNVGVNLAWRRPLNTESGYDSGYYAGLFAGHIKGELVNGKEVLDLGAGGELSYHLVNEDIRAEVGVGLGSIYPHTVDGVKLVAEPMVFFSASIALAL